MSTQPVSEAATADGPEPFVRKSKAEKKALRAQRAIEQKKAWRQRHKEAQHVAVAARATAREERMASMDEGERAEFDATERAERDRLYHEKVAQSQRVDEALTSGLRVALDLSYGGRMSSKEQTSLARQLSWCWGANRRAHQPISLHLAGLGTCPPGCLPPVEDVERWKVHRVEADVADAFPVDDLVFLSPDADEPLETLDSKKVYVIGGLVDSSVQKHTSLQKANDLGARTVRLPLAEHAPAANPRTPLTLTAVLEILLAVHAGSDWPSALSSAVAPRLLRPNNWENGRGARRQESRARANASWGVTPKSKSADASSSADGGSAPARGTELSDEHDDGEEDSDEQGAFAHDDESDARGPRSGDAAL